MGKREGGLNFYDAMKQGRTKITPEQERQNEEERTEICTWSGPNTHPQAMWTLFMCVENTCFKMSNWRV